tara:strand:+ start:164 stop:481 length:318 start_codon:yes stop_codon:yes gene_type:complete
MAEIAHQRHAGVLAGSGWEAISSSCLAISRSIPTTPDHEVRGVRELARSRRQVEKNRSQIFVCVCVGDQDLPRVRAPLFVRRDFIELKLDSEHAFHELTGTVHDP